METVFGKWEDYRKRGKQKNKKYILKIMETMYVLENGNIKENRKMKISKNRKTVYFRKRIDKKVY